MFTWFTVYGYRCSIFRIEKQSNAFLKLFLTTQTESKIMMFLEISIQPLAWFFLWEGFAKIFTLGELSEHFHFYTKMSRSQFTILSYEQPV